MKCSGALLVCVSVAAGCGMGANASAATLHGRVKNQQCSVLSQVSVRIHPAQPGPERTLTTDDGGNYTLDLPAGTYQVCVRSNVHTAAICNELIVPVKGDVWMTTQMRDAVPDLSNLGNRSY